MKKINLTSVVLIIILLVAILTNPSPEEHKQAVKELFNQNLQNSLAGENTDSFKKAGMLLGSSFIEKIIDNSVSRDNYVLFSITKTTWEGKSNSIGYGVFGNVFLSDDVKSAFDK